MKNKVLMSYYCQLFQKYDICRNNGTCASMDSSSYWQMCECTPGYHGLFCEMEGAMPGMYNNDKLFS